MLTTVADASSPIATRVKEARLQTAVRLGKTVSQAEMARLVGRELGRSLAQAQWSRYELGESDPPLDVITAMATVSGLSPIYIAFGAQIDTTGPVSRAAQVSADLEARGFRRLSQESDAAARERTKGAAAKRKRSS